MGVVCCGRGSGAESGGSPRKRRPPGPADPRLRAGLPGFPLELLHAPRAMVSLASIALPRPGLTHTDLAQALCGHLWHSETRARSLARLPQKLRC